MQSLRVQFHPFLNSSFFFFFEHWDSPSSVWRSHSSPWNSLKTGDPYPLCIWPVNDLENWEFIGKVGETPWEALWAISQKVFQDLGRHRNVPVRDVSLSWHPTDTCLNQSRLRPAWKAWAKAKFCTVALRQAEWEHETQKAHQTQLLFSAAASQPATIYTSLTFQFRHLFLHWQSCEVRTVKSPVISLCFGEMDSLTSLTLGKGRKRMPPGPGKSKQHRADMSSGAYKHVKNRLPACLFILSVSNFQKI